MAPMPRWLLYPIMLLLLSLHTAQSLAQWEGELDARGWPTGSEAEAVADAVVLAWLERTPTSLAQLSDRDPANICAALPDLVANPAPPAGTRIVLEERRELTPEPAAADGSKRTFSYAAVRPGDQLDVAQVELRADGDLWRLERVFFRSTQELSGMRAWLQTPTASAMFILLTLLVVAGLVRPSPLRRALASSAETMRSHRRTILFTSVLLGSLFALGMSTGRALPDGCDTAILMVVDQAVGQLGATAAYGSGNLARAAALTFYQNFVVVTFSLHFFLVLLLGVPSYLVAMLQFFVLGIPFGLLSGLTPLAWLPILVLIGIELAAYFLVISGGGIVVGGLFRAGFRGYVEAVRRAASLLLPAALLLLLGAWYEALIIIGF